MGRTAACWVPYRWPSSGLPLYVISPPSNNLMRHFKDGEPKAQRGKATSSNVVNDKPKTWTKVCSARKPTLACTPYVNTCVLVTSPPSLAHCLTLSRPASSSVNWGGLMYQSNDNNNNGGNTTTNSWHLQCATHYAKQFALTINCTYNIFHCNIDII